MNFKDRKHAGELLSSRLLKFRKSIHRVLSIPRGGVPVGFEVSKSLQLPLEILVVRRVAPTLSSDLTVGAIAEDGEPQFNDRILTQLGLAPDDLGRVISQHQREILRQIKVFRNGNDLGNLLNQTILLVDDGLATGATAMAAFKYLKNRGVAKVILGVPVASAKTVQSLKQKFGKKSGDVVAFEEHDDLISVGRWYDNFESLTDTDVLSLLPLSQQSPPLGASYLSEKTN